MLLGFSMSETIQNRLQALSRAYHALGTLTINQLPVSNFISANPYIVLLQIRGFCYKLVRDYTCLESLISRLTKKTYIVVCDK